MEIVCYGRSALAGVLYTVVYGMVREITDLKPPSVQMSHHPRSTYRSCTTAAAPAAAAATGAVQHRRTSHWPACIGTPVFPLLDFATPPGFQVYHMPTENVVLYIFKVPRRHVVDLISRRCRKLQTGNTGDLMHTSLR